jgi:hypothetical protein
MCYQYFFKPCDAASCIIHVIHGKLKPHSFKHFIDHTKESVVEV